MKEELHIIPHEHKITPSDREQRNGHRALVIWFTGLSGSGKSTLSNLLEQELYAKGIRTFILDGDNVRKGLNKDLDFSEKGRTENIRRIGEVAKLMADAGLVVLAAFVSPFRRDRDALRTLIGSDRFIEVFVDTPLKTCEQRDIKGLYKKAREGKIANFTGISSPFEIPETPDIHIETSLQSVEESLNILVKKISSELALKPVTS